MAMTTTVRHHAPVDVRHSCNVDSSIVTTDHVTEVHVRLAPVASATSRNACDRQAQVIYDALDSLLHEIGARPDHVLIEKVYFRNLAGDRDDFERIRREFYRKRGITDDGLPAITCLGQPPCQPGVDVEMQACLLIPMAPEMVRVESLPSPLEGLSVKLVEIGHARHLYLSGVTGAAFNGESNRFRAQSDRMFATARQILAEHGACFGNVLRTWIYLADIDADYAELNSSRNTFFSEERLKRLPASTGIGALAHPASARCALDVYALLTPEVAEIEVMTTPTLNEAPEYGSAFSRGMKMGLREANYLFVSGTASIDEGGLTVHEGDFRAQAERTLRNIEELLHAQGATWSDLTYAVTYLKSAEFLEEFESICAARGIRDVPHTIVQADVCRPELLCETEALAIVAAR